MFLECPGSWNSCKRPERATSRLAAPQSIQKRRTNLLETALSFSVPLRRVYSATQKIQCFFEKAPWLDKNKALFTQPRPRVDLIVASSLMRVEDSRQTFTKDGGIERLPPMIMRANRRSGSMNNRMHGAGTILGKIGDVPSAKVLQVTKRGTTQLA